jgi:tetratricopeptide (TPR) repeat protein
MASTDQPVAAAVAAHDRALAELAAGRVASAREAESRALELLRSVFGPTAPDVANVLLGAVQIEQAAGDLKAARALAADAVHAAHTWQLDDADLVGLRFQADVTLATLDQALGDLDAAETRLLDALGEARGVAGAERSVLLLSNALGVTYKFAGRLDDAQRCYDEVYDVLQSSPAPDPADLAGLFHNLAGLAHSRGDAASGILWAERGIAHRSTLGSAAELDLARDYGGLGALHHLAGHVEEAREAYDKALRGTIGTLGADHHEVAVVLANQAALEADVGDAAAAIELYRRALALLIAALGADHAEVRFVRDNLRVLVAAQART